MTQQENTATKEGERTSKTGHPSMKDLAYSALKSKILTNVLNAGHLIDDTEEARSMGMSKTPVREALLLLQAEGLVEVLPRRGIRVVPVTLRDMEEIYTVLTALEITAIRAIADSTPDAEKIAPLSTACAEMRTAIENDDAIGWNVADEAFHRGILHLSDNAHLAETGIRFRERVQRGHLIAIRMSTNAHLAQSVARHEETVALLLSDDPQAAVRLHEIQRTSAGKRLIAVLQNSGLTVL